jgi:hypothetical protein
MSHLTGENHVQAQNLSGDSRVTVLANLLHKRPNPADAAIAGIAHSHFFDCFAAVDEGWSAIEMRMKGCHEASVITHLSVSSESTLDLSSSIPSMKEHPKYCQPSRVEMPSPRHLIL